MVSAILDFPHYEPKSLNIKKGENILVFNNDSILRHTVTNGIDASDKYSAKIFDTGFIKSGQSQLLETQNLNHGTYNFFCKIHPHMKGTLTVADSSNTIEIGTRITTSNNNEESVIVMNP